MVCCDLLARMKQLVASDQKPATVTTTTFKRIKDSVLAWKESAEDRPVLVSAEELRARLEATDPQWRFTDDEMTEDGSMAETLIRSVIDHDREHWHEIAARLAGMAGVRRTGSASIPAETHAAAS